MSDPAQTPPLAELRIHREAGSAAPVRRSSLPWGWLALLALLVAAASSAWRFHFAIPAVALGRALRVEPHKEQELQAASGHLIARRQASVGPEDLALLVERFVQVGDVVDAGQLLGRLEHAELDATIEENRVQHAEAAADLARLDELAVHGLTQGAERDRARFRVEALDARLKTLNARLDKTYLRAPFAATVIQRDGEVGEVLGPAYSGEAAIGSGGSFCTLVDLTSLEIEANVAEAGIHRVRDGLPVRIEFSAFPGELFAGTVAHVLPRADRQRGTVPVRIHLDAQDRRLVPGLSAQIVFLREATAQTEAAYVTAPRAALRIQGTLAETFLYDDDQVRHVTVSVAEQGEDPVVVLSGLEGGELLVLDPPSDLIDGDRVRRD